MLCFVLELVFVFSNWWTGLKVAVFHTLRLFKSSHSNNFSNCFGFWYNRIILSFLCIAPTVADRAGVLEESAGEVLGFMAGHTLHSDRGRTSCFLERTHSCPAAVCVLWGSSGTWMYIKYIRYLHFWWGQSHLPV